MSNLLTGSTSPARITLKLPNDNSMEEYARKNRVCAGQVVGQQNVIRIAQHNPLRRRAFDANPFRRPNIGVRTPLDDDAVGGLGKDTRLIVRRSIIDDDDIAQRYGPRQDRPERSATRLA